MFKTIKENVDLVEAISHYTGEDTRSVGENVILDSDTCPFCGHKECFRIKPNGEESFYKCFSCDEYGDVITFVQKFKDIEKPVDACLLIAKDFKISLPVRNPIQEVFDLAARYYRTCYVDASIPYPELNGMTPHEYQTKVRGHKESTLETLHIGWSDGGLLDYLKSVGIDQEILNQSGLMNKAGKDFLPAKSFIYPHYVKGNVSHFTFKDPLKKLAYQLKSTSKLNGHQWYNQDCLLKNDVIIVVEGENDLASVLDDGWEPVIASIGQVSASQLDWLIENAEGKSIITIFDKDEAGEKYKAKFNKIKAKFRSLMQISLDDYSQKDIDEVIRSGVHLSEILNSGEVTELIDDEDEEEVQAASKVDDTGILVKDNCYFKVRYKDGEPVLVKISNFTICLKNVFVWENNRTREVVLRRADGKVSKPVPITSEVKTSLKMFKTFVANTIDGSFYGTDADLTSMWEHVYSTGRENEVVISPYVGKTNVGWLTSNKFITNTGVDIDVDKDGIFWHNSGNTEFGKSGIRAFDITTGFNGNSGEDSLDNSIPTLVGSLSPEESEELIEGLIKALAKNLGNIGAAITMMTWFRLVVYSKWFIKKHGHFPLLYLYGDKGGGKSTIIEWLLDIFDMSKCGLVKLGNVKSIVALERKVAYYSSLPVCIDEMRRDTQNIKEYWSVFRAWYDRSGRDMGTNVDSISIRKMPVRACVLFGGQDLPGDPALRERLILVTILNPKQDPKRETLVSYEWIKERAHLLPAIGFHWMKNYSEIDLDELSDNIKESGMIFKKAGLTMRYSVNYAIMKAMGDYFVKKYFPDFDWIGYLIENSNKIQQEADEEDLIPRFFSVAETLTTGNNPRINGDHYKIDGDYLYLWMNPICQEVAKENAHARSSDESFSKLALTHIIQSSPWYVTTARKYIGIENTQRRVVVLDLTKAPEYIKNFAKYNNKE